MQEIKEYFKDVAEHCKANPDVFLFGVSVGLVLGVFAVILGV